MERNHGRRERVSGGLEMESVRGEQMVYKKGMGMGMR